jgi:hypothetical protein
MSKATMVSNSQQLPAKRSHPSNPSSNNGGGGQLSSRDNLPLFPGSSVVDALFDNEDQ